MKQILWITGFLISFSLYAQDKSSISGQILDKEMNLEPLYHAEVVLKSSGERVKTNFMGNFRFDNLDIGKDTLEVRFPGYTTAKIPVNITTGHISPIQCALEARSIALEDMKSLLPKASAGGLKE